MPESIPDVKYERDSSNFWEEREFFSTFTTPPIVFDPKSSALGPLNTSILSTPPRSKDIARSAEESDKSPVLTPFFVIKNQSPEYTRNIGRVVA